MKNKQTLAGESLCRIVIKIVLTCEHRYMQIEKKI